MTIQSEVLIDLLKSDLVACGLPVEGDISDEMTPQEAAAVSIRKSLVRKWTGESSQNADAAALEKFLASNQRCREWVLPDISFTGDVRTSQLMHTLKWYVWDFWLQAGQPLVDSPFQLLDLAKVGPGSNRGAYGESHYAKLFASPLSCTSDQLYRWYRRYTDRLPYWNDAEEFRSHFYGESRVVEGSRLSFVPKNVEISRCICTEPTLNTYFQLGFGLHLERRLQRRFGISLTNQQFVNRDFARLGSITDSLATLDLSSASDTISNKMLEWLLPPDFFRWLQLLRSPVVEIPGLGTQELYMVSSMGNGFTFPLQTVLFSCVVAACLYNAGIPQARDESSNLWGVFGDDIICPSSIAGDVIHLLTLLGFSVNGDKSFVKGPFRESCGSDFFRGSDIRGVYLKDLSTMPSRYSAINQLARFSTRNAIPLPRLIGRLLQTVKYLPVPRWENIDSGIHVPRRTLDSPKRDFHTQSDIYRAVRARPIYLRFDGNALNVVVPRRSKPLIFNSSGLLVSMLQGGAKSGIIPVRVDRVKYQTKRCISPNWDWCPDRGPNRQDYGLDWVRWESTVDGLVAASKEAAPSIRG
jgi:hypothetical protein